MEQMNIKTQRNKYFANTKPLFINKTVTKRHSKSLLQFTQNEIKTKF